MIRSAWYVLLTLTVGFAQIPIPAGFPNGNTTGPIGAGLSYSDLKASAGMSVTTAGAVIQGLDISGGVTVKANNVTIKNCRIRFGGAYGIANQASGTKVEYCEVAGTQDHTSACINASNMTISHCNIYGAADGIKTGSNTVVEYSWVHDLRKWDGTHNDCLQNSGGGKHIIIRYNTLQAPYKQTNAVSQNSTNVGPIDDMLFENNFMSGGGYVIQMRNKGTGYGDPTNIRFVKNVFEKDSYIWNLFAADGNGITYTCNRFHTGELIPQNKTCNDAGTVAGPRFSPDGGNFNGTVQVSITCATAGAAVYYTTNGSTPTTSSAKYSAPFTLTASTTVKAIGVKSGMDNSPVTTAIFKNIAGMVIIEAENMTLGAGYIPDTDSRLIGQTIMVDPGLGIPATGTATTTFTGPGGTYEIVLTGVPENDGEPVVRVYINNTLVLTANYPMDAQYHTLSTRLDFSVKGVTISQGDVIKIEGTSHTGTGGSFARVDKITLIGSSPVSGRLNPALRENGITVGPNPMRDRIYFRIPGCVGTQIYDQAGNTVYQFVGAYCDTPLRWCGTDITGRNVKPGMYFYRTDTGGQIITGRIIKVQ